LFDELWNSGNHEEMSIAIHIMQQYRKKLNVETWKFLKQRLNKAVTWDHIDYLATDIFAEILKNNPYLMPEIKEMADSRNPWERRLAVEATYKLIKQGKIELTLRLAENLVYDDNEYVQKGVGWMLREAGKKDRTSVREFILNHINMKPIAFSYATEKVTELRKIRKEKRKEKKDN
jgi:3-methyladenine DNA glycosylase AlkD